MAETKVKPNVDEIAKALREDTGELDFGPQASRLFIQTLRLLTEGRPISPEQVMQLAAPLNLSGDEVNSTLGWLSERNEAGHIVGLAGLSLNDWTHKFKVNGRTLSTWCALDTLYLPAMLKQTAEVASPDPVTQEIIRLTIAPHKVEQYTPTSAVISVVIPKVAVPGLKSAEEIWTAFCNYSHYFTSAETAREWFEGKSVDPVILSIEQGRELVLTWFEKVHKYA